MQACFIGHRTIENSKELVSLLNETVLTLINKGVTNFLFGSKSAFDSLAWQVVTKIKNDYPFIKRVYVRSSNKNISKQYKKYLLKFYEDTIFPFNIEKAGRGSYVERNFTMIDKSIYCVFYYNENYIPMPKRNSGTKVAYNYALRKTKEIINLFNK